MMELDVMTAALQRCGRCKAMVPIMNYSPSYRGKTGTWCRACFAAYARGEQDPAIRHESRACTWCGEVYVPKRLDAKAAYCSRKCKWQAKNAQVAAELLASKRGWRKCAWCALVIPPERSTRAMFCSDQHASKAHALQRKMRARTGSEAKPGFLRAFIFQRDGWCCGICGGAVDRDAEHPDPMAPSLDHIKPVSLGGGNELSNLRLTHLVCNLRRGNRPVDQGGARWQLTR